MLGSLTAVMSVLLTMGQVEYVDGPYASPVTEFGGFHSTGFGGDLYPYDSHYPWVHGYFQEIPAYGGFVGFRPYNYKHVLSQSQAAGGWGLAPTMPYSQQFWHRYHQPATLHYSDPAQVPQQHDYHAAPTGYQQPPMAPAVPSYPELFQR